MPRPKSNNVSVMVRFNPDVAQALRAAVKVGTLSQSHFVQDAVIRALRGYRPPLEFIAEGREKKGRKVLPGALDVALDSPEGWPLTHKDNIAPGGWRILWNTSTSQVMRDMIDRWRGEDGRDPVDDTEWAQILKHMGTPGKDRGKPQPLDFGGKE